MMANEPSFRAQQGIRFQDEMKKPSIKSVSRWLVLLILCVGIAVLAARWWAGRSEAAVQARMHTASLVELERLAPKREWDPQVLYWLGVRLTEQGRHKEAASALARSCAMNPRSAAARAAFGLALARVDRPGDAESQLLQ